MFFKHSTLAMDSRETVWGKMSAMSMGSFHISITKCDVDMGFTNQNQYFLLKYELSCFFINDWFFCRRQICEASIFSEHEIWGLFFPIARTTVYTTTSRQQFAESLARWMIQWVSVRVHQSEFPAHQNFEDSYMFWNLAQVSILAFSCIRLLCQTCSSAEADTIGKILDSCINSKMIMHHYKYVRSSLLKIILCLILCLRHCIILRLCIILSVQHQIERWRILNVEVG